MKKSSVIILIVLCLALLGGIFFYIRRSDSKPVEDAGAALNGEAVRPISLSNGQDSFAIKGQLETLLLIGTDSDQSYEALRQGMEGKLTPFYNHVQSDFLVLLVFDHGAETVTAIQLNRDTMFDVPWTDVLGNYGGTEFKQLALSYNSGSGLEDSCENTCLTISSLLFGAPVDHYAAFAMCGIATLNDLVGGVVVDVQDDLTPYDPTLVKGTTVRLKGTQAESFIRSRMLVAEDDTNLARMRRHRDYFDGFMESAAIAMEKDDAFPVKAYSKLEPYTLTDMSVQKLSELATKMNTYDLRPVLYAEGRLEVGEFYEFYPDMEQLWEIVKESFSDHP